VRNYVRELSIKCDAYKQELQELKTKHAAELQAERQRAVAFENQADDDSMSAAKNEAVIRQLSAELQELKAKHAAELQAERQKADDNSILAAKNEAVIRQLSAECDTYKQELIFVKDKLNAWAQMPSPDVLAKDDASEPCVLESPKAAVALDECPLDDGPLDECPPAEWIDFVAFAEPAPSETRKAAARKVLDEAKALPKKTVEELTELLALFDLEYVKPKQAAVKALLRAAESAL
jgi:hypothetical protein